VWQTFTAIGRNTSETARLKTLVAEHNGLFLRYVKAAIIKSSNHLTWVCASRSSDVTMSVECGQDCDLNFGPIMSNTAFASHSEETKN